MKLWERAEQNPMGLDVKRVGGSGSGTIKGDQIGPNLMVEVKTTGRFSYSISDTLVSKTKRDAAKQGRTPVIRIHLRHGFDEEQVLAVIPWEVLQLLLETQNE